MTRETTTSGRRRLAGHAIGVAGLGLFAAGSWIGLVVAPAERHMGEVGRILYVHVPTAWVAMLVLTAAAVAAAGSLWRRGRLWDDALEATLEVGVVLTAMLLIQGSLWAKPTWGVFWTWDPRLTTSAVMLVAFLGVLALRSFVDDPDRRAVWSAVATVVAYVDVPIVYFSIHWWRTLHQDFSTPETVAEAMHTPLRLNAFGVLLLATWLVLRRMRLVRLRRAGEARAERAPEPSTLVAGVDEAHDRAREEPS